MSAGLAHVRTPEALLDSAQTLIHYVLGRRLVLIFEPGHIVDLDDLIAHRRHQAGGGTVEARHKGKRKLVAAEGLRKEAASSFCVCYCVDVGCGCASVTMSWCCGLVQLF